MSLIPKITTKDILDNVLRKKLNLLIDQYNRSELAVTVFDDYLIPGLSLARQAANNPTIKAFRGDIDQLAFAGTGAMEEAFSIIHLLHGFKQGTSPTIHIHWGHIIGSPTGNVKWNVDYTVAAAYGVGTFDAPTTLSTIQAVAAQYVQQLTDDDDMTVVSTSDLEPDGVILIRVYRDPADEDDTFENDAYLFHIDLHYERSHIGTTERNRIWTSTGYT